MKQKKRMFVISATAMLLTASITQTVTIPVEATELQQTQDDQYYLFEDSSYRLLEYEDISTISTADIRIAKNEIYARHGRKFSSEDLQQYFSQLPWYQGTIEPDQFDENSLNEIERANVNFLDQEYQKGTGAYNASVADSILLRVKGQSEALL